MHAYLELIRFDKPVGTLLLMLPCWWGVLAHSDTATVPYAMLALFALGSFAMRSAGCILNDMADRTIDAQVERTKTRPLASGALTMRAASLALLLCLCVALIVAMALGWKIVALGACWLPLVAAYPFMKRITFWPQVFLGITFGAGGLFGGLAISGSITATSLWLYGVGIVWVLGYDTIYACQDVADDARIGVKSSALRFGDYVAHGVGGCYALMLLCLIAAMPAFTLHSALILAAITTLLGWQVYALTQPSPDYMRLFKSNAIVGGLGCMLFALA